jgi:hypothetical protein
MNDVFTSGGPQSTSWAASSVAMLISHVNSGSCGTGARALEGTPFAQPIAPAQICKSSQYTITDEGLRAPTAWAWSSTGATFGNASAQTTTLSYATIGVKTLQLTSSNSACGASTSSTESVAITVIDETAPQNTYIPNATNTGTASFGFGMGITNVTFGSVNRSSGNTYSDGNVYDDYSCEEFDTFSSLSVDVTFTIGDQNPQNVGIYVDSDNDGTFENYYLRTNPNQLPPNSTETATLTLPEQQVSTPCSVCG